VKSSRTCWIVLGLVFLSLAGHAQDFDDDDEDFEYPSGPFASLQLFSTNAEAWQVSFSLPEKPQSWDNIRSALSQALSCPASGFHSPPAVDLSTLRFTSKWTAKQRQQYEDSMVRYNERTLTAECPSFFHQTTFSRVATLDFTTLNNDLAAAKLQQFYVTVALPSTKHIEYSREHLLRDTKGQFLSYNFPVQSGSVASLRLAYGINPREIYRSFVLTAVFVLVPIAGLLWVRRAALKSAEADPTAAWFSYFRVMNWGVNGSVLFWVTSGLGARQRLQEWVAFSSLPAWEAAFLDASVVIIPAFLVYFACVALSYPLHVQLRGRSWKKREFLIQQLATVGAQALPLMFFLGAISSISKNGAASAGLFISAYLSWIICHNIRLRLTRAYPFALTTGELRDRVFDLAKKAGVEVRQIFVLPTGKGQVANAYASGAQVVMFTDYLLERLTKREVDGVAAHELSHLRYKHVPKRLAAFYCALVLPALLAGFFQGFFASSLHLLHLQTPTVLRLYSAGMWFWHWSQRDFILILLGLAGFYFLSRRFEHEADAGAVLLTGDPEAQITGLLKLSRLNLMPIHWGRGTSLWITHPSTVHRAERIAAAGGMSAEQLNAILEKYRAEASVQAALPGQPETGLHYSVPESSSEKAVRSAARTRHLHQIRLWTGLLAYIAPSAIMAGLVHFGRLTGNFALAAYIIGLLATPVLCTFIGPMLSVMRRSKQKVELQQSLANGKYPNAIAVGFAPGAVVRFYGHNYYSWDIGLLSLERDRMAFLGEQVRFSVPVEQIDGICLGQGGPSWWKVPRVYIRWKNSEERPSVFSLGNLEPCSILSLRKQQQELCERLNRWRHAPEREAVVAGAGDVPALAIGQVTSIAPNQVGRLRTQLVMAIYLFSLAAAVNLVMGLDSLLYLCSVVIVTRIFESIPYWSFRDRLLSFVQAELGRAAKA
jgi:Zn-dependent protease with chaperone function